MDIHETRKVLRTKSIFEVPLRVAYYARVSTEKDEQLNSLNNQQVYYENLIKGNPNWEFIRGYVDEGLSAITTKKRENFHKMVADAKLGKFDFLITKEITRFARNTLDSIEYTRKLLSYGVGVLFQNDNINTLDEDSELRLTIMSGIAQDEVRKLSSRIRFGHQQSIQNGVVMGNSRIYGYEKQNGALVINEAEAEMIRLIFKLYATGDYSTPKIEKLLDEKGYRNYKGGKINRGVINHIIVNPKYKGYYCGNKVKIVDMFTKKQKFLSEDEWVMYKDESKVPAIVDETLWNRANEIFSIRSEEIKSRRTSFKTDNLFTGKIICSEHDTPFYLKARVDRKGNNNSTWVCSHRIKNGSESCKTYAIKENELTEILTEVLKELSGDINGVVEKYLQYVKQANSQTDYEQAAKELNAEIEKIHQKKEKILELSIDGKLTNDEFAKRNDAYNLEIKKKNIELQKLDKKRESQKESVQNIFRLKSELIRYYNSGKIELTSGIVNTFVDKIYVTGDEAGNMTLQIRLNTGNIAVKNMSRSDYTFKKMIEAQERQMAGGTTTTTTTK